MGSPFFSEIPPWQSPGSNSEIPKTASGGQFDWGGRLPKGNGGAQRSFQAGRKSAAECKGRGGLDCETHASSKDEVGLIEPALTSGRGVAQRIKVTLGITG